MKVRDLLSFLTLTIGLTLGVGVVLAGAYRVDVARNWDARRCDPGVVATAGFFKPRTDPRTARQFATDNWSFCQKEYVQNAIRTAAAVPKELAAAEGAVVAVVRDIAAVVADVFEDLWLFCYDAYSAFMDRMKGAGKLMHNFMIQLHSIVERLQAAVLSIIFGLMALITAYISATQLAIIVALIIIGIIVALEIILFYLFMPITGLIIAVTTIISLVVVLIATAIAAAMVAEMFTPGACFATGTPMLLADGSTVPIESVRVGARLSGCDNIVTATHQFRQPERLFRLHGVCVTGDHLITVADGTRIRVRSHPDAVLLDSEPVEQTLWCLTTTAREIPVRAAGGSTLRFADWEEIADGDTETLRRWYRRTWRLLNPEVAPALTPTPTERELEAEAGLAPDCVVPTVGWWGFQRLRRIAEISVGDWVYTRDGMPTQVVGRTEIAGDQATDAVVLGGDPETLLVSVGTWVRGTEGPWRRPVDAPARDLHPARWIHLYTAAGEFQIGRGGIWTVRDASEVGLGRVGELVDEMVLDRKAA